MRAAVAQFVKAQIAKLSAGKRAATMPACGFFAALFLFVPTLSPAEEPLRAWTSVTGHETEARFVEMVDKKVLLKTDSRTLQVPFDQLSKADREWINIRQSVAQSRTWKSKRRSIEGQYLRMEGGYVVFDTELGIQRLRYRDLAGEDQRLVGVVNDLVSPLDEPAQSRPAQPTKPEPATPHPALKRAGGRDDAGGRFQPITRTWTDRKTGNQIVADYLGREGDKVILLFRNRERREPIARFSDADQQFVESLRQRSTGGRAGSLGHAPEVDLSAEAERLAGPRFNFENDPRFETGRSFENSQEIEIRDVNGRRQVYVDGDLITGPDADRAIESFKRNEREFAEKVAKEKQLEAQMAEDAKKWAAQRQQASRESPEDSKDSQPALDDSDIFAAQQPVPSTAEMTLAADDPPAPGATETEPADAEPQQYVYTCPQCARTWNSARERTAGSLCPRCQMMGFDRTLDEQVRISPVARRSQPREPSAEESDTEATTSLSVNETTPEPPTANQPPPPKPAERVADSVDIADQAPAGGRYSLLIKIAAGGALAVGLVLFFLGRQTL